MANLDAGGGGGDSTDEPESEEEQFKEGFDVDTLKDETTTRRERDTSRERDADTDDTREQRSGNSDTDTEQRTRDSDSSDMDGGGGGFNEQELKEETTTRRERDSTDRDDGGESGGGGGGGGVSDAERQQLNANLARVSSAFRAGQQGVERGANAVAEQARALEQRVLDAYGALDASDVAITREGDVLRAGLTATGREAMGINPTQRELANRRREIERQLGGAVDAYAADRERSQNLSQAAEIDNAAEGIRRAVDATGQRFDEIARTPGPVDIGDLSSEQQDRVNEALVKQYSEQKGAYELQRRRANAEQFGGSSSVERALRAASQSYSEFVEDATTFGDDNNLSLAIKPVSTGGPFPGTVSYATLEEESESESARATRGLVTGGAEVFNLPAYGVLGIEAGEVAVAGGQAAARGEFGGYDDVAGIGTDVLEYTGLRDEPTANAADRDAGIDESFIDDVGTAGLGLTDRVVTSAQENPYRFGGQLVGGTAFASGALTATKGVAGGRAARALDVAFDPATPVTRGIATSTRRAAGRVRRGADDLIDAERGQFTPGTKLDAEAETETMAQKEAMIEVEAGTEAEAAMLADREAFLEGTRYKRGSGEVEMNTEAGEYDVGPTRMEQERVDSEADTAEERLPPPSEFESEAAYERELDAMRERMAAERDATLESDADADVDTEVEAESGVGMDTAAVFGVGTAAAGTTAADAYDSDVADPGATVQPFVTQEELATEFDQTADTEVSTDVEQELDQEQERTRTRERSREFDVDLEQELDLEQEQEVETELEQELEQELELEVETEFEQELELEQEMELEQEAELEIEVETEAEGELEMEAMDEGMLEAMREFDARNKKAGLFENDVIAPEELDEYNPVD